MIIIITLFLLSHVIHFFETAKIGKRKIKRIKKKAKRRGNEEKWNNRREMENKQIKDQREGKETTKGQKKEIKRIKKNTKKRRNRKER